MQLVWLLHYCKGREKSELDHKCELLHVFLSKIAATWGHEARLPPRSTAVVKLWRKLIREEKWTKISIKHKAKIIFFLNVKRYFKTTTKRRKGKEWDVLALPHARAEPRRGHGGGSWSRPLAVPPHTGTPDRSWQDFLAEMGWAQTLPHKWQIKSGSECEKWVTAAERRTSPAQRQRAAKDGGAAGGTPRPSLVVLLCKFGSARQPVSPAVGSCPRWISLNAPCPACAY